MSSKKHKNSVVIYPTNKTAAAKCHTGNVAVMRSSKKDGGTLYCGGWSRGAYTDDVAVIDLTGTEPIDVSNPMKPLNDSAASYFGKAIESANQGRSLPWLSFRIKDFGVPSVGRETWVALANTISQLMDEGHDILMACNGGHGRTGTAASIICYLLNKEIGDPVEYLRKVYCDDAVETFEQHKYVHKMLGLPEPKDIGYKHDPKAGAYNWGGYGGYLGSGGQSTYQTGYVWDEQQKKWVPPQSTQLSIPPTIGGSVKPGWWLDDLTAELEANFINYDVIQVDTKVSTGLSSIITHVEVCMPEKEGLTYYQVDSYDKQTKTVKIRNIMTGETKQAGIEFLATREEVDRIYGQP